MSWWLDNNVRLIQNNLRDIDAAMDVDRLVEDLKYFDCNCVMVGAAGITAYYPSKLPTQWVSPYLPEGKDTLGEIVEKCHQNGIRVIVRFDFSKVHDSFEADHPDWLLVTGKGEHWHFNDTVQTCLCGKYQQEESLKIIEEVITRYPVDGIFFNYFGMPTADYARREYGICHCDACKEKFREFSGFELPEKDSPAEVWKKHDEFRIKMCTETMGRVTDLVRSHSSEIGVSTYHYDNVDMVRNESNSSPLYGYPYNMYLFQSAQNVAGIRTNANGTKISSNCIINAYSINHRFTGESPDLNAIRLYEEMAQGGILDWCIIGVFEGYPDREVYEGVREVFHFHKENFEHLRGLKSEATVALLHSVYLRAVHGGSPAFSGAFRALKTEHIPFDMLGYETIEKDPSVLDQYKLLIVTEIDQLTETVAAEAQKRGVLILCTDMHGKLTDGAAKVLGAQVTGSVPQDIFTAGYWFTREKDVFKRLLNRDWLVQLGDYNTMEAPGYKTLMPFMSASTYAPPERAYGHKLTDIPGVLYSEEKKALFITWPCAETYYQHGNIDCRNVLADLIDAFCPAARTIRTNATAQLEIFYDANAEGKHLLQLLNLTGYFCNEVGPCIPLHDVEIVVPLSAGANAIALKGSNVKLQPKADGLHVTIVNLGLYEAILLQG